MVCCDEGFNHGLSWTNLVHVNPLFPVFYWLRSAYKIYNVIYTRGKISNRSDTQAVVSFDSTERVFFDKSTERERERECVFMACCVCDSLSKVLLCGQVLAKLHQVELLGCRLVVELAHSRDSQHFPTTTDSQPNKMSVALVVVFLVFFCFVFVAVGFQLGPVTVKSVRGVAPVLWTSTPPTSPHHTAPTQPGSTVHHGTATSGPKKKTELMQHYFVLSECVKGLKEEEEEKSLF